MDEEEKKLEGDFKKAHSLLSKIFGNTIFHYEIQNFSQIGIKDSLNLASHDCFIYFTPFNNCLILNKESKDYLENIKKFIKEYEKVTGIELSLKTTYASRK